MTYKLLFLCTGNYYRSRFAEMLFNARASKSNLDWEAASRGFEIGWVGNVGPISVQAIQGLKTRGIDVDAKPRFPLQLMEADLAEADLVIALKEAEHRPYLAKHFPAWLEKVEYWHIDDLDVAPADEALAEIERAVKALLERLAQECALYD